MTGGAIHIALRVPLTLRGKQGKVCFGADALQAHPYRMAVLSGEFFRRQATLFMACSANLLYRPLALSRRLGIHVRPLTVMGDMTLGTNPRLEPGIFCRILKTDLTVVLGEKHGLFVDMAIDTEITAITLGDA